MNYARNYKNLLNFDKVMPKILVVPFFSGHGVYSDYVACKHWLQKSHETIPGDACINSM